MSRLQMLEKLLDPAPMANEDDRPANLDLRASRDGRPRRAGTGLHRRACPGGPGTHSLSLQAAECAVPRSANHRRAVGRARPASNEHGNELEEAGASQHGDLRLLETRQQLEALLPLLDSGHTDWPGAETAPARAADKSRPSNSRRLASSRRRQRVGCQDCLAVSWAGRRAVRTEVRNVDLIPASSIFSDMSLMFRPLTIFEKGILIVSIPRSGAGDLHRHLDQVDVRGCCRGAAVGRTYQGGDRQDRREYRLLLGGYAGIRNLIVLENPIGRDPFIA